MTECGIISMVFMALFANDEEKTVDAWSASPKKIYSCLECRAPLKMRRTKARFPHFYHVSAAPSCRLYSKSESHLRIQLELQKRLPPGEIELERPFIAIHRIADAAWEKQKIIFEIQCSSISEKEAKERNEEYRSLNYQVVWILDDRLFNKRRLRPAEEFLRKGPCYFVSHNQEIFFYDQFEILANNRRLKKGSKIPIIFHKICQNYFENDRTHKKLLALKNPSLAQEIKRWHEQKKASALASSVKMIFYFIQKGYLAILHNLLKRHL